MQKFLDVSECCMAVKKMLASGKPVQAAVAYWGAGAIEQLGIDEQTNLTVVCDVRSGGCNVAVIKQLLHLLGPDRVRTCDRLHAKVWLTEDGAIVGSSNASANGLGFEGPEVASLVEANLFTDAQAVISSIGRWMEIAVKLHARPVTAADLRVGEKRHARTRDTRPVPEGRDLLSLLKEAPDSFLDRNAYVWVWEPGAAADWAYKEVEMVQSEREDENIDFYQDISPPPSPNAYIFDFNKIRGGFKFVGLYRVLGDRHLHKATNGSGELLLCRRVRSFEGLGLGSMREWRHAAEKAADSGGTEWQLAAFAQYLIGDQG